MGYKTEINYILKCSNENEGLELHKKLLVDEKIEVTKSGNRTFVLNSPILLADHHWTIVGMCSIYESSVSKDKTILKAHILTVFTPEERIVVSKVIQAGEKAKVNYEQPKI